MDLSLNFGVMISISYSILVMIIHYYYFLTSMQPYTIVLYRKTFLFYTKIVLGKIISFTLFKTILCRIVLYKCLEIPIDRVVRTIPTRIHIPLNKPIITI